MQPGCMYAGSALAISGMLDGFNIINIGSIEEKEKKMKLARVFQDNMVMQRRMPILIWGSTDKEEEIIVRMNGQEVYREVVIPGAVSFQIPPQEAAEDVALEIGDITLHHVDFGEVWVAGGQSNMEFMLKYDQDGEGEIASANDAHLRTYIVGQYSFAGEREEGYKSWNPWDRWLPYKSESAAELPAVAVYFAKELRKAGIPVGILSCNWGGTTASAWLNPKYLLADPDLKTYVDDFQALVDKLDLERYFAIKKVVNPVMNSPQSAKMNEIIVKNTFHPDKSMEMIASFAKERGTVQGDAKEHQETEGLDSSSIPMEEIMAIGPGDKAEPGSLYENMLKEILGYSVQGVIWYQGETDEPKAWMYDKLFTAMINCWRREWKQRNDGMERMPFLFVQLAPYGTWMNNTSERYPILRRQQEIVSKSVQDVYMTSISDIGNVYDIHPKEKAPVGKRLSLLARKYVYGETDLLADAPEAKEMVCDGDTVRISFRYGDGLYQSKGDFSQYNGFALEEIWKELVPPVLGGINGLRVYVDEEELTDANCTVEEEQLLIHSSKFSTAESIKVEFAQTAFYQVNLFNRAELPVKPFVLADVR